MKVSAPYITLQHPGMNEDYIRSFAIFYPDDIAVCFYAKKQHHLSFSMTCRV